jgi:hypothetical protein
MDKVMQTAITESVPPLRQQQGLRVYLVDSLTAGYCNGCNDPDQGTVYRVVINNLEFRLCLNCAGSLKRQLT